MTLTFCFSLQTQLKAEGIISGCHAMSPCCRLYPFCLGSSVNESTPSSTSLVALLRLFM